MQSNSKLAESVIRNTLTHSTKVPPTRDGHNKSTVHFNLNELYYELEPNFELSVKFYQMDLSTDGQCGPLYRLVYRQFMNDKNKSSQITSFAKRMMRKKAALKSVKPKKDNMLGLFDASNGELKMTNVASVNMDNVLLAGSAFKPIGSLSVNRSNWAASPLSIDQFDFSWSVTDHKATIDCDLSIDYGPRQFRTTTLPDLWMTIIAIISRFSVLSLLEKNWKPHQATNSANKSTTRASRSSLLSQMERTGISISLTSHKSKQTSHSVCTVNPSLSKSKLQKHLHFGKSKFKFHKCTMLIEKRYLRVRSKGSSIKFDLACCLNPLEPSNGANHAPNIRGLSHQTVCLVFTGALQPVATGNTFLDPYPNLRLKDEKAKMNGFQFVFANSNSSGPHDDDNNFLQSFFSTLPAGKKWNSQQATKSVTKSVIISPKADRLSEFYQHVLCRVHSVREWN